MSIAGIVLIAYADGFKGPTAVGIVLAIAAAIGSALYKVSFDQTIANHDQR